MRERTLFRIFNAPCVQVCLSIGNGFDARFAKANLLCRVSDSRSRLLAHAAQVLYASLTSSVASIEEVHHHLVGSIISKARLHAGNHVRPHKGRLCHQTAHTAVFNLLKRLNALHRNVRSRRSPPLLNGKELVLAAIDYRLNSSRKSFVRVCGGNGVEPFSRLCVVDQIRSTLRFELLAKLGQRLGANVALKRVPQLVDDSFLDASVLNRIGKQHYRFAGKGVRTINTIWAALWTELNVDVVKQALTNTRGKDV